MNDPIAALLYLLGRHVTTALRVRHEDEEVVLSRRQVPPLQELHESLERGEQLAVDPWTDLENGPRALVCLWARTPYPEVTADDLPAPLRPQAWVRQGGSALAVWSLAEPTAEPGGSDPARAMREIAAALGITACDPRDYIPVPADPQDIVFIDPARDIDVVQLLQWAHAVLGEKREREQRRREQEDAAKLTALRSQVVSALAAVTELRRGQEETPPRGVLVTAEHADEESESLRLPALSVPDNLVAAHEPEPCAQPAPQGEGDPWAILWHEGDGAAPEDRIAMSSVESGAAGQAPDDIAWGTLLRARSAPARSDDDDAPHVGALSRLAAAIADARRNGGDEGRLQAMLVEAMAELGTRDVWAALGVGMTFFHDGTLYGLRGDRWFRLRDLLATE